ncbi:MAG: glutaredoxin 3 [Candidatus Thiodiazotropha sp. (ex Monitilora ramsayi)]|nr:glutaredoxin 3 [Candidatus Thiodiazotropha sp. (ex Monitilora ramsayi)]
MRKVEIYTQPQCPYCHHAKALLEAREIVFQEYNVAVDQDALIEMVGRTGGRTLPQIVINDKAIGGFDDLSRLDSEGQLSALLEAGPSLQ